MGKIAVRAQWKNGLVQVYEYLRIFNNRSERWEDVPFDFEKYGIDPKEKDKICALVKDKPSSFEIPQLIELNII